MRGKKLIAVVCAAAVVIGAAVAGIVLYQKKKADTPPDIRDTPIPLTIDVTSALTDTALASTPIRTNEAQAKTEEDSAVLFGQKYRAQVWKSTRTIRTADNVETAAQRKTDYLDANGDLVYTSLFAENETAIYNASGVAVYSSGIFKPEADYLTEPVHWFYAGGALACGELCFYDDENTGVAYYNAAGTLLCVRTEIFKVEGDSVQMLTVFYDRNFEEISEDDFNALLPRTDADAFLYVNWS